MPDEYKMQLYLTRHGESWGNLPAPTGEEQSVRSEFEKHDPGLTPLGLSQAKLLGERLSLKRFDAIFSSPLIRAVSTASETAVRQPGGTVPVELIGDLREAGTPWDYPGYALEEIIERYPYVSTLEYLRPFSHWAASESADEQQRRAGYLRRAGCCIDYFRKRFQNGESIFVAAHGTFNTYLIRAALGLDNTNDFNFCQENTGLTKIKYFLDGKARLSYSNETSHLFAENPLITFTL